MCTHRAAIPAACPNDESLALQVLKGVPAGEEAKAQALSSRIADGLRSVNGAIDARHNPFAFTNST